jgi:hypothetical protein
VGNYVDSKWAQGETVLYRGKLSWAVGGWFYFLGIAALPMKGTGIAMIVVGVLSPSC